MKLGGTTQVSRDCPECGAESVIEVEYGERNYDERDGHVQMDYEAEIVRHGCQCETEAAVEEAAIREVEA